MKVTSSGQPLDLLGTDHLMPGMSGTVLAGRIRAIRPGVATLRVSGYAERRASMPAFHDLPSRFRDELVACLSRINGQ